MLTKVQFKNVKGMIKAYWDSLVLSDVEAEFKKSPLLNQNTKLAKGSNMNMGLELLPSVLAPRLNTCPAAGDCRYSCLAFSGRANIPYQKELVAGIKLTPALAKRTRRTFLYQKSRAMFEEKIIREAGNLERRAEKAKVTPGLRLNTTSDLDWLSLIKELPAAVQKYDYTKVWDRVSSEEYRLTYSASEHTTEEQVKEKLAAGNNVAVVFPGDLPSSYLGYPVISGDVDDDRYLDPPGHVVGLVIKNTLGNDVKTSKFILPG